jgi:hypothetical protein
MMSYRAFSAVAVLSTTLMMGCGGSGPIRDPMRPGSGVNAPVRLTVQNNDFNDAVIYADWEGGLRDRVALFTGKTSQTASFPWRSDVVQFYVDFIAGDQFMIEPIPVQPGDHLDIVLLAESSSGGTRGWQDPSRGR